MKKLASNACRSARRRRAAVVVASDARADSVAQVATAKRISRQTVALIDPQGTSRDPGGGANTLAKVGDILTFIIQFTPVPNGAYRGLGGYITDYIPPNTEVVGARIVDRSGNTVSPHRGGLSCDGLRSARCGLQHRRWSRRLDEPALRRHRHLLFDRSAHRAQLEEPGDGVDEPFLSLKNGLQMPANPSGAGQFAALLNTNAPYFAHNAWDQAQVAKWGPGNGNMPEQIGNMGIGYGSPVAGPQTLVPARGHRRPAGGGGHRRRT